jgi:predicted nucleic acid-binding protein
MLQKYSEVLARPKFAFSPDEISDLIELLYRQGDLVRPTPLSGMSLDPKDDKFMACALAAQVNFVVTGNKKDFPEDQLGVHPGRKCPGIPESDNARTLARERVLVKV